MERRALAEAKTTWAGGIPQVSLAKFKVWMSTSSVERAPSRPFGRWGEDIAVAGSKCTKSAWEACCQEEPEPHADGRSFHLLTDPVGGEIRLGGTTISKPGAEAVVE